ncbi:MAG: LPXTG cell wall anchor domain-containing protein, partial [Chloroflexi bacterium]
TVTPNLHTRTSTIQSVLTQNFQQTQTQVVRVQLTGTATALPSTGFAEDIGLPGLFGLALGLVLVIVLVRRLRLSPNG